MDVLNQTPEQERGDCPSNFKLDGLHAGDLELAQAKGISSHINSCKRCAARMAERQQGFTAFGDGGEQAYLARFCNRLDEVEREHKAEVKPVSVASWFQYWIQNPWLPTLVGAAMVLIVWNLGDLNQDFRRDDDTQSRSQPQFEGERQDRRSRPNTGIRSKGTGVFLVYLQRDKEVREIPEHTTLTQGDRLRFKVSLPRAGHVMLVGEESQKRLYPISAGDAQESIHREAGVDQLLENAIELDGSIGHEWIHMIYCPTLFNFSDLNVSDHAKLVLPAGCSYRSFAINKLAAKGK